MYKSNALHPKKLRMGRVCSLWAFALLFLFSSGNLGAEGSKDLTKYPGKRLFFWAEKEQQIKVFATEGEFINVGSSHLGISGGFIQVFRPDGTLHSRYDDSSSGTAVIMNDIQEQNGPVGAAQMGYEPGIVGVGAGEAGIWTVTFEYPAYTGTAFTNLENDQPWTRADQPTNRRVVLAWDVTVSQAAAGNAGGVLLTGRVYSNDYNSIMNRNGNNSSPVFYVLTKEGFQYEVKFDEVDPWGFPIYSNNVGLVNGAGDPIYRSNSSSSFTRASDQSTWSPLATYLYEPQAEDSPTIINNKIFFNFPDPFMPLQSMTTDVWRNNTHMTWLYNEPTNLTVAFADFAVASDNGNGDLCQPNSVQQGVGGYFSFATDQTGEASLLMDIDGNGSYTDPVDRSINKRVTAPVDSLFWDGLDGEGNPLPLGFGQVIKYSLSLKGGEIHIMLEDVENDNGGLTMSLINDLSVANPNEFYYDHEALGGTKSGNGTVTPMPTTEGYTYTSNFGNEKLLDYWAYVNYDGTLEGEIAINIMEDCNTPTAPDTDKDGISDIDDIDDDNDGVPDIMEYCNPSGQWTCLPGGVDPSHDEDGDARPNYLDADDPAVMLGCLDADGDGICDEILAIFDTDGDGVPDHLDLDSDNDGITDLVEAGHEQPDMDGNGVIDGDAVEFGLNGFYNPIASDPDDLAATPLYTRFDTDGDDVPDHDDLDSDNDAINDVAEAGYIGSDTNGDGRVDDGSGNVPIVSLTGLVPLIDPAITGTAIPLPPDWDGDMVPDWHDLDSDNDGINDVRETNLPDPDNDGRIGFAFPEVDDNGIATADGNGDPLTTTSDPIDTDSDMIPDWHDKDSDDDTIFDTHEANNPDEDNDGIIGEGIPSVNIDGQPNRDANNNPLTSISDPEDHDGDGMADFQDIDRDQDGIVDGYECETYPCPDTDNDGILDVDDLDSDEDGILDTDECANGANCPDDNDNGMDNFREYDCNPATNPVVTDITKDAVICEGEPVILTAMNETVVTDSVTYTWTGPGGFFVTETTVATGPFTLDASGFDESATGMFSLTLMTDRGCPSDSEDVFVTVKPKPEVPVLNINKPEFCEEETLNLSTTPNNGDVVTYEWIYSDGTTSSMVATTDVPNYFVENLRTVQSGMYQVSVISDGCTSAKSNQEEITVNESPAIAAPTNDTEMVAPACVGDKVQLDAEWIQDATYQWFGPDGFTDDKVNPVLVEARAEDAGEYFVVVTKKNCSTVTPPTQVYINPTPDAPVIEAPEAICAGTDAMLQITFPIPPTGAAVSYDWFNAETNEFIETTAIPQLMMNNVSGDMAGKYFASIKQDGCDSKVSEPQTLIVDLIPNERAYTENDIEFSCSDEEIVLSAVAPMQAQGMWTSMGAAQIVQPEEAQTIAWDLQKGENAFVWMLSNGACINYDTDTLYIMHETEQAIANDDEYVLSFNESLSSGLILENDAFGDIRGYNINITSEPRYGSLNQNEDGTFTYEQLPNFFGFDVFTYEICNANCPDQCDEAIVTIRTEGTNDQGECFVPNFITPNQDGSNDNFVVPCLQDEFPENEVSIFNRWGDKVFDAAPYSNDWDGTWRNEPLPPGTYFYCMKYTPNGEAETGYITIIR